MNLNHDGKRQELGGVSWRDAPRGRGNRIRREEGQCQGREEAEADEATKCAVAYFASNSWMICVILGITFSTVDIVLFIS